MFGTFWASRKIRWFILSHFAVLTKNLMMMITTLLLCMAVLLYFGHSELGIKFIFGSSAVLTIDLMSFGIWIQPCMAISVHNSIKHCFTIPGNKIRNQVVTWFLHLWTFLKYTLIFGSSDSFLYCLQRTTRAPSFCGVCCLQINNAGISGVDRDPVLFAAFKDKVSLI